MKVIKSLREIVKDFDCFLFDQFGVLHNGDQFYPGATDALLKLKKLGKQILLISNSGKRAAVNLQRMEKMPEGPPATCFDFAITSGEFFREYYRQTLCRQISGNKVFVLTRGEDNSIIEGLDLETSEIEKADFILLAGLNSPQTSFEEYQELIQPGLKNNLPLVCANPDKKMIVGDNLYPASGKLANFYEENGGEVIWIGKPYPLIFRHALQKTANTVPAERILMIGDSLEHDIAGANQVGISSLFITGGIHREEFFPITPQTPEKIRASHSDIPKIIIPGLNF